MATHSSILAWEIPWTEEPGGLQSWDCRIKHNLVTKQLKIAGVFLVISKIPRTQMLKYRENGLK